VLDPGGHRPHLIDLHQIVPAVEVPLRQGEVRQAISVIKTRTSRHERTIREFQINEQGLVVGEPLRAFQGVLTGAPTYAGENKALMPSDIEGRPEPG